jgi:hypothetical protein
MVGWAGVRQETAEQHEAATPTTSPLGVVDDDMVYRVNRHTWDLEDGSSIADGQWQRIKVRLGMEFQEVLDNINPADFLGDDDEDGGGDGDDNDSSDDDSEDGQL